MLGKNPKDGETPVASFIPEYVRSGSTMGTVVLIPRDVRKKNNAKIIILLYVGRAY